VRFFDRAQLFAQAKEHYTKPRFLIGKNWRKAEELCKQIVQAKISDAYHADALNMLGEIYILGSNGITRNPQRAATYFIDACDGGSEAATFHLAEMYASGTGVSRNPTRAEELYLKAIRAGHPDAARRLEALQIKQGLRKGAAVAAGLIGAAGGALAIVAALSGKSEPAKPSSSADTAQKDDGNDGS
jgi:TPR repeat protein